MTLPRVVFGLLLACAVSPAWAADPALGGRWSGKYVYPEGSGQEPVTFEMRVAHVGERFTARTSEPNTFGQNPKDPSLYADCAGVVEPTTRTLTWTKTYDGTSGVSHDVEYTGTVSDDGDSIKGTWAIGSFGGTFTLAREADGKAKNKKAAKGDVTATWRGKYEYPGGQGAVPFEMALAEVNGKFAARVREPNTFAPVEPVRPTLFADGFGKHDGRTVTWTKTYDGTAGVSHPVEYRGELSKDGTTITGTWDINGFSGPFTMTKAAAESVKKKAK